MYSRVATMHLDNATNVSIAERPPNKYYEADVKQTVQYPRLFLGLLGVWPMLLKDSSTAKKYLCILLIVISLILLTFIIIPPLLHIMLREKDPKLRLMIFGPTSYNLTNVLKYGFFLFRFKTIKLCVEHVETDWMVMESQQDRAIMTRTARVGRSLTIISCIFTWSGGIALHTIMPLVSGKTVNEYNETLRPLAYPGFDILVDLQLEPTYVFIFFTICVSAFVSYNVTSASCSFTAGFVSHACGQIQIIISQLEILVHSIEIHKNDNQLRNWLSLITQCHIRVLRLSSRIEKVVREICLIEVVSSTTTICLIEYYLVTEWSNSDGTAIVTYIVALIANSFNIFIFCYIGELLKEQGRRVGEAAYMIEWYKLPCKSSHDLMMIIIMSNYCPPKITAGRVFELSIGNFGAILRMSLTYCNMLRALTDSENAE